MNQFDCVVSLTTWKGRINDEDTCRALFSLINQKTKYKYKVVLTLSKEEFPNQYDDLPEIIKLMYNNKYIDIIWADDNYKAFKKLYPIIHMYDCPILTTDDDIICQNNIVERFMDEHKKTPNMVLSEGGIKSHGLQLTGGFRLFPKNSLLDISPEYFKSCFQNAEDDVYISMLMNYKGTKLRYIHSGLMCEIPRKMNDKTALRNTYRKINSVTCRRKLDTVLRRDKII